MNVFKWNLCMLLKRQKWFPESDSLLPRECESEKWKISRWSCVLQDYHSIPAQAPSVSVLSWVCPGLNLFSPFCRVLDSPLANSLPVAYRNWIFSSLTLILYPFQDCCLVLKKIPMMQIFLLAGTLGIMILWNWVFSYKNSSSRVDVAQW